MSLERDLKDVAAKTGGKGTQRERKGTAGRFSKWCRENNIQLRSHVTVSNKHVRDFMNDCYADAAPSTKQKVVSHFKVMCPKVTWSNDRFGASGRSRQSPRRAPTNEWYEEHRQQITAEQHKVTAELQRWLGLRQNEALESARALRDMRREVDRHNCYSVYRGAKGGNGRTMPVVNREKALNSLDNAIAVADANGGHLVAGGTIKSARNSYNAGMRRAGFVHEHAPHSLRAAYAHELMDQYKADGYSWHEALSKTAVALGHGDQRGRDVRQKYLQGYVW